MISLNTPIGCDGTAELLDMFGTEADVAGRVEAADDLARPLSRLQPVERALLVAVHTGTITVEAAAARLGKSPLAVTRMIKAAERKARGRKRSAGTPSPGAGHERPIGTIRIRKWHRCRARFIKVRADGPASKRWVPYARWLWVTRNGDVPVGKCVIHKDGDTLNDDPDNLILGGHADRAFLYQSRSDANYRRSMRSCREGCRRHNRERAIARDLAGDLRACQWYAVDHAARTITGPLAKRSLGEAYLSMGVSPPAKGVGNSARAWIAAQLGWPHLPCGEAIVLAALAGRPEHAWSLTEIAAEVQAITGRIGRPMRPSPSYLHQFLYGCRCRRLVETTRRGQLGSVHRAMPGAVASRGPICLLAVMRGHMCRSLKDDGYIVESNHQPLKGTP